MVAFYIDENVAVELAALLRRYGHGAATTGEERRLGASDAHQLLHAAQRNWIVLTHNRYDFHLLHTAWLLWGDAWHNPPKARRYPHHRADTAFQQRRSRSSHTDFGGKPAMLAGR